MPYYHREIETLLQTVIKHFPACLITGARQVGKSTLLKKMFAKYEYISFDDPVLRSMAKEDPGLFISSHPAPVIIDEIQYVPEILSYIKMQIDNNRNIYGQYILTGSQSFSLMEGVSESLAGRIMILNLLPFNWKELDEEEKFSSNGISDEMLRENIFRGFYPELHIQKQLKPNLWYGSYLSTYIERDLRNIKVINDLQQFQKFLMLLAMRVGQLLKLSEVAKECGISSPTAKKWLSILESSYIIYLLKPYYKNRGKRLVKSPKIYFYDTGLLCYLLSIDEPKRLITVLERGHIFENMLIIEMVKKIFSKENNIQLFFYRTTNQLEVDLIVEKSEEIIPYEIKYSKTIKKTMVSSLNLFMKEHDIEKGYLLSLFSDPIYLMPKIKALHWSEFVLNFSLE